MSERQHIVPLLHDYLDGALTPSQRQAVEVHLRACPACREEHEALASVRAAVEALPRSIEPPRDLWPEIEARLAAPLREEAPTSLEHRRNGAADRPPQHTARSRPLRLPAWAGVALVAVLMVSAAALWLMPRLLTPAWTVARLEGVPRLDAQALDGTGRLRTGQWLETDGEARAAVDVGVIGRVEVAPNTRLQLLKAHPTDHRLALAEGTIHAKIWAPPRLFFVETPSALAIDLGCEYTLEVDSTGGGLLHVTSGYVALEHGDRSVVVPAGSMCRTHPQRGPGTPFDEDAGPAFRNALNRLDFEADDSFGDALAALLAEARPDDAATLWLLMYRLPPQDRGRLYDGLTALVPPPDGVTRDGVLRADLDAIEAWEMHLGLDLEGGWFFQIMKR